MRPGAFGLGMEMDNTFVLLGKKYEKKKRPVRKAGARTLAV